MALYPYFQLPPTLRTQKVHFKWVLPVHVRAFLDVGATLISPITACFATIWVAFTDEKSQYKWHALLQI